ncbi:MAG: 50S ribosomal protein L37ae [Thaumarchaeota archaeon]|jgi:large subunit ribosomal protein L37Ae|nr:50S ribosomal protein L37ae [Nitrososphaerota archaeon]
MTKKISGMLGAKYGFTLRRRYAEVILRRRAKYYCPKCQTGVLKRVSVGIWQCRKCGYKFAGGAYEPFTKTGRATFRISKVA